MPYLPLHEMDLRHRGLTPATAANNAEALSVCLSRHHNPTVTFRVEDNGTPSQADLTWTPPDVRTLHAWGNSTDATEMGACACVIACVELLREHFAVRRADITTGADYYIGPAGAGVEDLEDCLRLEVSGVDAGDVREVRQRLLRKTMQARRGNSSLPAVAGVVGYAACLILLADVEAP